MADDSLNGPLSQEDLLALWVSATDETYNRPYVEAGDGGGLEAYSQGFAQLARVSTAVDRSTQALYILPFSGQTNPPAAGEARSSVALTFTRGGFVDSPLVLGAGMILVGEQAVDSDEDGPVLVETGRRYVLQETVVFFPGEQGPLTASAVAERPGYGYDNPAPGTINLVDQPGSGFFNDHASVVLRAGAPLAGPPVPASRTRVASLNQADMFVPDHVGQYVAFTAGANALRTARVVAFLPPDPAHDAGSVVDVEQLAATTSFAGFAGTFAPGETADVKSGVTLVGRGTVVAARTDALGHLRVALVLTQGALAQGDTLTGQLSGATAPVDVVLAPGTYSAETGTAAWRVLDWAGDWKLAVTNASSPAGGRSGMLDLLGAERGLPRHPGEVDDDYRERVAQVADVVTPNAIRRALNRTLGAFPWCFREVGSPLLPGLYCDRAGDPAGDFYDTDAALWSGAYTSGTFLFGEPVRYLNALGYTVVSGRWGSYLDGGGATHPSAGANFTMTRPRGRPPAAVAAGDAIVGQLSGAVFTPTAPVASTAPELFAWHVWLDYVDFRAFFAVGVPRVGFGEFGCAYDAGPHDAYDCAPFDAFYDGFPAGAAAFYGRVYGAVEKVRAGGVSWVLYRTDGEPCA